MPTLVTDRKAAGRSAARRAAAKRQTVLMTYVLPEQHRRSAEAARGFMPPPEGEALFEAAAGTPRPGR